MKRGVKGDYRKKATGEQREPGLLTNRRDKACIAPPLLRNDQNLFLIKIFETLSIGMIDFEKGVML
jgi:hypothetical protein